MLRPGFEARSGSTFVAKIDTDRNFNSSARKVPIAVVRKPYNNLSNTPVLENVYKSKETFVQDPATTLLVYPNPATAFAHVKYVTPQKDSKINLTLYDIAGNVVSLGIEKEQLEAGHQQITIDVSTLPSGIYYYKLRAGDAISTKKLIITR